MQVGDHVTKRRWSTELETPRGGLRLRMSPDATGLAPMVLLLLVLAAVLVRQPAGSPT